MSQRTREHSPQYLLIFYCYLPMTRRQTASFSRSRRRKSVRQNHPVRRECCQYWPTSYSSVCQLWTARTETIDCMFLLSHEPRASFCLLLTCLKKLFKSGPELLFLGETPLHRIHRCINPLSHWIHTHIFMSRWIYVANQRAPPDNTFTFFWFFIFAN